jgi:hypothetical protein
MKRAAFGVRMHSGWGVLVAVSVNPNAVEVLARYRIVTADLAAPGANQPYHYAARLAPPQADKHLAECAAASTRLAATAIDELLSELTGRHFHIVGASVLLASGRPLPPLPKILAAHPLIHTAEGEFFRNTVSKACESLDIPVTAIRERELDERAKAGFGNRTSRLLHDIASLGSVIGPPWTRDHKAAAVAAALILQSDNPATMPSKTATRLGN